MVEQAPAFQFYPNDFLSDKNTMVMSAEEIGAYWLLLCVCWQEKILPDEMEELSLLARMPFEKFKVAWDKKIKRCFIQVDGGWSHPRLDAEREKQRANKEKRSNAGKIGNEVRHRSQSDRNAVAIGSQCDESAVAKPRFSSSSSSSSSEIQKHHVPPDGVTAVDELVIREESETLVQARELALFLRDKILERHPKSALAKPAGLKLATQKWPIEIERMLRLDGRSPPEVRAMIAWVTGHEFWAANILSASKLREKWDTLAAQKERDGSHAGQKAKFSTTRVFDENVRAIAEYHSRAKAARSGEEAGRGHFFEGEFTPDGYFPELGGEP